jgi:uncharacterized membrane protein
VAISPAISFNFAEGIEFIETFHRAKRQTSIDPKVLTRIISKDSEKDCEHRHNIKKKLVAEQPRERFCG